VTPEDTGSLQKQLAKASAGEAFVLMGGDCAEALPHQVSKEQNTAAIHHASGTVQVLQQMAVILAAGTMLPVVKIGRMAGQSAKPRSEAVESRDGVTLPAYRGDLINGHEFSAESRRHDPQRMLSAYKHAKGIRIWPDSSAEDDIYLSG
jgi:3-deoxy-7-phosphoheptulonate synthase